MILNVWLLMQKNLLKQTKKLKTVDAKNELEGLAYSTKNQANDAEKLGGKLSEEEKDQINTACDEVITWLESNQEAETQAFKDKKEELQSTINPIVEKVSQQAGGEEEHD